ncbi:MAG: hypothetical protein SFX73_39275 [Kofleriaceae bacterium]|nr:hypothetical protein [Kofleriaceae bacterium]
MKSTPLWLGVLAALTIGCGGPDGRPNDGRPDGGGNNGDGGGSNTDDCSDDAKLVYVVDSNNMFSRFDPSTKTFQNIGALDCPAEPDILGFPATPFSMGIDRTPTAWVLYSSGELFKVNTDTAACEPTSWTAPLNLPLFGMGFSTDAQGGSAETLYIAGGTDPGAGGPSTFASLNTSTMTSSTLGSVQGSPELTGTGNAELWGFFPSASGSRVEKINKASGASAGTTFTLSGPLVGQPSAWAFAFWGGDFWVFLEKSTDSNTTVYQIDGTNGSVKGMTNASGRSIVGAGVSTCAPTIIL